MNRLGIDFTYSNNLLSWLKNNKCGFVFTSYKTNRIYSIGSTIDPLDNIEKLSIWFTEFDRPTGITINGKSAWLVTKKHIIKYENKASENNLEDGFDCSYTPILIYSTNTIDAHDITVNSSNDVWFCNTKFSCLSSPSCANNFDIKYTPPWISKLAPEDRCHLNGLCTDENGDLRYISTVCNADIHDGWRDRRGEEDGFVYDIIENSVVCANLTMPHSPRYYDGKLWVLNSGKGEFGYIKDGEFVPVTFIPGFLRGLDFIGKYAIIGSSMDRHEKRFSGLKLGDILKDKNIDARCGIYIVDINKGYIIATMIFDNLVELYDVKLLKNTIRPRFLDINHDSNEHIYRFDE